VIGRFFGTTNDESRRTELIMLITPRVVRNRQEATSVTAEFKNKLSTVRDELERMRREQEAQKREKIRLEQQRLLEEKEKEKQRMQEQEEPVTPAPSSGGAGVAPSPSSAPAVPAPETLRETSIAPEFEPSAARHVEIRSGKPRTSTADPLRRNQVAQAETTFPEPTQATGPQAPQPTSNQPAAEVPTIAILAYAAPIQHREKKASPTWTVQVASFRRETDAGNLAKKLKGKGYSTHVTTAQIDNKTWYRVRIGEFTNRGEAGEIQRQLASRDNISKTLVFYRE